MNLKFLGVDWYYPIIITSIIVLAVVVSRISHYLLTRAFEKASEKLRVDSTRYKFFRNTITSIIWLIAICAIIYSVPSWRTFAITLFAGAGVLLAIVGFAGQQAFANIISGIFIVIFRPFRVGDLIKIGDQHAGYVLDITLRHVVIRDFNNRRIIVPNTLISNETIINHDIEDNRHCQFVEFSISYDSDVDLAMHIMREEALKHPFLINQLTAEEKEAGIPQVKVKVIGYGDSSVNLRAWCWAKNFDDGIELLWDLNEKIKKRFDAEGIEIPFPHRTIVYKNKQ